MPWMLTLVPGSSGPMSSGTVIVSQSCVITPTVRFSFGTAGVTAALASFLVGGAGAALPGLFAAADVGFSAAAEAALATLDDVVAADDEGTATLDCEVAAEGFEVPSSVAAAVLLLLLLTLGLGASCVRKKAIKALASAPHATVVHRRR